jgi:hypothetical protein
MVRSPRSVRHLLQDKPGLQRLEREIHAQESLLADVRRCLPADLSAHCLNARLRVDTLVLHTDSPVWATRLRYLAPQLASVLAVEYPALREVKIRLFVASADHASPKNSARHSDRAAEIIHSSADHANSEALQAALHRLGKAVKPG